MEQRVSLVTLGVVDLARARTFYESLGWSSDAEPDADVVFFQAGCMIVALWDRAKLVEDTAIAAGREGKPGDFGGITLAYNVGSPPEVDAAMQEAESAGATVLRAPAETFWGGYSGVFADPDGFAWEVAHNPFWTLGEDGSIKL